LKGNATAYFKLYPQIGVDDCRKSTNTLRAAGLSFEIRTHDLSNMTTSESRSELTTSRTRCNMHDLSNSM